MQVGLWTLQQIGIRGNPPLTLFARPYEPRFQRLEITTNMRRGGKN